MRRSHLFAAFGALLAGAPFAHGSVTFTLQADKIYNSNGSVAVASGMEFVLIAHESATGNISNVIQGGSSLAVGSLVNSNNDRVVFASSTATSTGTGPNGHTSITTSVNYDGTTGLVAGDQLEIVWFPSLATGSSTVPVGTSYGAYTNPSAKDGSNPFVAPADPNSGYFLGLYTVDGGFIEKGTNPASAGYATLVAVPEPGSVSLGLVALGVLGCRRLRRAV